MQATFDREFARAGIWNWEQPSIEDEIDIVPGVTNCYPLTDNTEAVIDVPADAKAKEDTGRRAERSTRRFIVHVDEPHAER